MDWVKLIAELQELGFSQTQIAEECGCAQPTVSDLARGVTDDPRDSLGQSLRALLQQAKAGKPKRRAQTTA